MKIVDVAKEPIGKNPHNVDARKVYDTEHATAVVITLAPGESLKKHITPVDVFFYVLEGTGIVGRDRRRACRGRKRPSGREPGKDTAPPGKRERQHFPGARGEGPPADDRDKIALRNGER